MSPIHRNGSRNSRQGERGVALVITLLLLILMIALTLAMVIATSSDTLINHYYRNFRSSFYAADSGLNIARGTIQGQLSADIASPVSLTTSPLTTAEESTVQTLIQNTYGGGYTSINSGPAGNSWPGKFKITSVALSPSTCSVTWTTSTAVYGPYTPCATATAPANPTGVVYSYNYPYALTAMGQSMANEAVTVQDNGSVIVNITGGGSSSKTSFAAWGTFLDQYPGWPNCGDPFAPGTLTGPFFTNEGWTFGTSGTYIFTDTIGSVAPNFYWNYGSSCDSTANASDKKGSNTIAPTFQAGYKLGQTAVPLPPNDFNQKEAVLDGLGNGSENPTNANMAAILKNVNGNPYPASGTSNPGVYLPYTQTTSGGVTTSTLSGGGIYVEGDANVTVTASTSGGHNLQVFTITQSSSGGSSSTTSTTTVTLDLTGKTTSVASSVSTTTSGHHGGTTTTNSSLSLVGVPQNLTATTTGGSATEGAMLYVDGTINSLSGPSSGAAIQDTSAVTITAAEDINITGNLTYATEPVTTTQNQIPSTPADTLIPANNNGQVLGLFTANGNILFNVPTSGQNLEIDASLAAISNGGSGAVYNGGNAINTVNIVGGRIANTTNNCNCNQRNIYFDRRFATGGFAPPWFPATTVTVTASTTGTATLSVQRTQWVDVTAW